MAAFIAKQMVGNQLKSVKGALGEKDEAETEDGGKKNDEDLADEAEMEEVRREAEEKRKEKHRLMEEERETMRQGIRDKYGLKKKEKCVPEEEMLGADGRIGRKKKSPAELAAEGNQEEDEDEFTNFPTNLSELTAKVSELPQKLAGTMSEVSSKCSMM